jgi:ferrous iron transport protein B
MAAQASIPPRYVVLTGNPNSGKTTLFNALTGLRARVGNYAGVTVERKEGRLAGPSLGGPVQILDLPGTYSLSPQSLDEQVSRDVLFHRLPEVPEPGLVVVVVDASNLERNFYYAAQVLELGYPTILALNMMDVAEENGSLVDCAALSAQLGVPVVPLAAPLGRGLPELRLAIHQTLSSPQPPGDHDRFHPEVPALVSRETADLAALLPPGSRPAVREAEALLLLTDEKTLADARGRYSKPAAEAVAGARSRMEQAGLDWRTVVIESRYVKSATLLDRVVRHPAVSKETLSDRIDRIVTHKFWGLLIFFGIMALMFLMIFSFANVPMKLLQNTVVGIGGWAEKLISAGALNELLVKGVINGVGAVVVFLPQICLLFLFIGLLEDTGYMARAAFLMDRLMSKVGLHGKSFIPMLSSFACAIPGIMATRTIETPKDRLVTILVAPLMSCSARLPVYTLLIGACFPNRRLLSAVTMWSMYLLGIVVALAMAWLFKKTLLQGPTPLLIMELPPYKRPVAKVVLRHVWDRSKLFLRRAGTVILGINILLWFLASYPKNAKIAARYDRERQQLQQLAARTLDATNRAGIAGQLALSTNQQAGENLRQSFAGRAGRLIEPAIRPLGFDWKMGIGIAASFAAREVFVSTMSIVYNVGESDPDDPEKIRTLSETLKKEYREDGKTPVYTPLTSITLMVFYVLALQCVSTVAVVRRETNSWKWPLFQWAYMGALAWLLAFVTWQGGLLLGFR